MPARAGAAPPCRLRTGLASSRPIHTPVVIPLEKPRNQPSLFELVVPVLPATGRPISAARPVPVCTAACKRSVMPATCVWVMLSDRSANSDKISRPRPTMTTIVVSATIPPSTRQTLSVLVQRSI